MYLDRNIDFKSINFRCFSSMCDRFDSGLNWSSTHSTPLRSIQDLGVRKSLASIGHGGRDERVSSNSFGARLIANNTHRLQGNAAKERRKGKQGSKDRRKDGRRSGEATEIAAETETISTKQDIIGVQLRRLIKEAIIKLRPIIPCNLDKHTHTQAKRNGREWREW